MTGSARGRRSAADHFSHSSPIRSFLRCNPTKDSIHLRSPQLVGVLGPCAGERGAPDLSRTVESERLEMSGDVLAITSDQNFLPRLKEQLYAFPGVRNDAGACASGLEHAGCRRKSHGGHAVPRDIQHGERRRIECVVVAAIDVPEMMDIRRELMPLPTVASDEKVLRRKRTRR